MEQVIPYLVARNELDQLGPLEKHIADLSEIKHHTKLKSQSAIDEDFEAAIMHKGKIQGLEKGLI